MFSNRYGHEPVQLGAVHVDDAGTSRTPTFAGQPGVAILPGATVTSDPVALPVQPLSRLAVTTWLPAPTPVASFHWGAQQTVQVATGNDATSFGGRRMRTAAGPTSSRRGWRSTASPSPTPAFRHRAAAARWIARV
jgi:hypothetical protein